MKIESIKVISEKPVENGKLVKLDSGKEVFVEEGFLYIEIELLEGKIELRCPANGELRVFNDGLDLRGNKNGVFRISYNPTPVESKIIENIEKLYPEVEPGFEPQGYVYTPQEQLQSITLLENVWELYNSFKTYTNIQGGTVEFNKEGEIEKLIAHFKNTKG